MRIPLATSLLLFLGACNLHKEKSQSPQVFRLEATSERQFSQFLADTAGIEVLSTRYMSDTLILNIRANTATYADDFRFIVSTGILKTLPPQIPVALIYRPKQATKKNKSIPYQIKIHFNTFKQNNGKAVLLLANGNVKIPIKP